MGMQAYERLAQPRALCGDPVKGDNLLAHPQSDLKDMSHVMYQAVSYGSCLSALRSKMICVMGGNLMSKGSPRMCEVKSFQPGAYANQQVPQRSRGSPLTNETFLHTHTRHTKYPKIGEQYSLASNTHWSLTSNLKGLLELHGILTRS